MAHIRHPIAEPFRGGMEAHVFQLARGMAARGHDVTLFAAGDSDAGVPLRPLITEHYDAAFPWHDYHGTETLNTLLDRSFGASLDDLANFDIVHNNSLHRFPPRHAHDHRIPMVTSLHVPPFRALRRAIHCAEAEWLHYTTCSEFQRKQYWPKRLPLNAHVVPNGIDLSRWQPGQEGNAEAVWAGRITPTKAPHLAARAAQQVGMPIVIYGIIEHRDYFESELRPLLSPDIRYGGHLSTSDLADALRLASVLVFTPLWDEPFGLVAAEAMVCGTPVAAFDAGGVPEVVRPAGGRLAPQSDVVALSEAITAAVALDRSAVAAYARYRFSGERMLDRYEACYRAAINATEHSSTSV